MKRPKLELKHLRWLAYGFAYLFTFVLFAYLSFPYDRLRQHVVSMYNAAQIGPNPDRLEIDSLSWSWRFPGILARGVRLSVPSPESKSATEVTVDASAEEARPPAPQVLEAAQVYVSFSPLALLTGARAASFGANALGGEISGWARDSTALRRLELQLDGVNPGAVPQLAALIGLPLSGRLSGHIALDLPENNLMKAEGSVELAAEDLVLGDGKAKIQGMIALPELHMGAFTLKAGITGGRLKLDECVAQGKDVDLALTGGLRLRKRLEASLAELELKFSFSEKYKGQNDLTKALFGQPDSKIPGLFDTATSGLLTKQEDGSYAARLYGPFNRLKPKPLLGKRSSSSVAEGYGTRKRTRRRGKAADAEAEGEESGDTE
ncbi:MAG: type II secretion system protein GspN [Deltaproteobacteria bacterium]